MIDLDVVRQWMKTHGIGDTCPMCQHNDLRISDKLYQVVPTPAPVQLKDLDQQSGAVRLRCARCAHLMFFHARSMGIHGGDVVQAAHRKAMKDAQRRARRGG